MLSAATIRPYKKNYKLKILVVNSNKLSLKLLL